jgi:WD40 repeat protein
MKRALERHQRREALVIPIILRHVYWQGKLGTLQALPTDAKPVRSWSDVDEALFDVTEGIRKVVVQLSLQNPFSSSEVIPSQSLKGEPTDVSPAVVTLRSARPLTSINPEDISLLNTFTGHTNIVRSVAFSPDSQTLASGSYDNTIKLWNLASGKELRTLTGHKNEVTSVAFSPDGRTLASSGEDQTIKLWGNK